MYDTAWAARMRFPQHVREMRLLDYTAATETPQQAMILPDEIPMDYDLMADLFGMDLLEWDFDQALTDALARPG